MTRRLPMFVTGGAVRYKRTSFGELSIKTISGCINGQSRDVLTAYPSPRGRAFSLLLHSAPRHKNPSLMYPLIFRCSSGTWPRDRRPPCVVMCRWCMEMIWMYMCSNQSCSICLCSWTHCRWSFHWQSLLPAADPRSFYHSSGSPRSLLWLLGAAGCWILSSHFSVHAGQLLLCPSQRAASIQGTDSSIQNLFPFDQSASGGGGGQKLLTERLIDPLCFLRPDRHVRGEKLHKAILRFYKKRSAAPEMFFL